MPLFRVIEPDGIGVSMMVKWLIRLISLGLFMAVLGIIVMVMVFWHFGRDLPDHHQLAKYEPPVLTRVHAGNGALLAEFATEKRVFIPIDSIPNLLSMLFCQPKIKGSINILVLIFGR